MKFSESLKYNAVPEWHEYYVDYSGLREMIYSMQNEESITSNNNRHESSENRTGARYPLNLDRKEEVWCLDDKGIEDIELDEYKKPLSRYAKPRSGLNRSFTRGTNCTFFDAQEEFLSRLIVEKRRVDSFYERLEAKLFAVFDNLLFDLQDLGFIDVESHDHDKKLQNKLASEMKETPEDNRKLSRAVSVRRSIGDKPDIYEDNVLSEDVNVKNELLHDRTAFLVNSGDDLNTQKRSILKRKIKDLYVDFSELKSFIELNRIGILKLCHKFDKTFNSNVKNTIVESGNFFDDTHIFSSLSSNNIDEKISYLVQFYSIMTNQENDLQTCKDELRWYLRNYIVWERNYGFKKSCCFDFKQNICSSVSTSKPCSGINSLQNSDRLEYYTYHLKRPLGLKFFSINRLKSPKFFFTIHALKIYSIILLTIVLLNLKTFDDEAQQRCMSFVTCISLLWATEALPLFVTAMLVPLLGVLFRVVKDNDGSVVSATTASSYLFGMMWSSTIMVLLAGFTLAAALSKYNIANISASYILSIAGTRPRHLLLVAMCVVFFLSIWISNVAAPVLTYSLIHPVLENLNSKSPFAKALVLGIALAANVGGMASPISSPQNVLAMDYLAKYGIGWGKFFAISLPVSCLSLISIWLLLILTFEINAVTLTPYKYIAERFTSKQIFIILVSIGTILSWCGLSKLEGALGSSGIIAILPIVLFFGTGLLTTNDLNNFNWSIILLAMGGIALGSAVSSSGLLVSIAISLQKRVQSYPTYGVLCIFGIIMLVFGTFVSHTVSAIIILPLVQEIGEQLPSENAAPILVFGCTLLASCGMGLASSGFPNITAISMTDQFSARYLSIRDFLLRGIPSSLLSFFIVISVGYSIMFLIL